MSEEECEAVEPRQYRGWVKDERLIDLPPAIKELVDGIADR